MADPISAVLRQINGFNLGLPAIGVSLFFLISGFLVTKSFDQRSTARTVISARVMRIFPALMVNVLACIALGAVVTTLPLAEYLSSHQVHRFFYYNASAIKSIFPLPVCLKTCHGRAG